VIVGELHDSESKKPRGTSRQLAEWIALTVTNYNVDRPLEGAYLVVQDGNPPLVYVSVPEDWEVKVVRRLGKENNW